MNKPYKNIDDLFKDKFDKFEVDPPDYLWDKVKAGIPDNLDKGSGFNFKNGGIAGITLILITLGILSFFIINNAFVINDEVYQEQLIQTNNDAELMAVHLPDERDQKSAEIAAPAEAETVVINSKKNTAKKKVKKEKKNRIKSTNPNRNSTLFIEPEIANSIPVEREALVSLTVNPFRVNQVPLNENLSIGETGKISPTTNNSDNQAVNASADKAVNSSITSDMVRAQENPDFEAKKSGKSKSDYAKHDQWAVGIYFTPEMIVYPSDNQLKNYSYSLDLHATYKKGNYFLQSGLGLARNHEQGNSMVNYNKYLGSYDDVYNITYDSTSGTVVPVYHTETVNVFDSVNHVVVSSSKNYYTYLQLPLFIGYGEESKRFGWFVKGGPSISFLVHENISGLGFQSMDARILNVENELPARINTNWQFVLSAGATYKLGTRVSISVEPMFRYYIKSVYEQDKLNTKHPYSIGLRTGFLLNF